MPMHPMDEEGVDDMATLTELHGGAIMHNLYQRYKRNQIYVSSALGPFKILPLFSFLLLCHTAHRILVSGLGIKSMPPAVKTCRLNH